MIMCAVWVLLGTGKMFAVLLVSGPLHLLLGAGGGNNGNISVACGIDFWGSSRLKGSFGSREMMRAEGSTHLFTHQIWLFVLK